MKFIKVLWFDLKNGYFKGVSCYIFPLFIANFISNFRLSA